MKPCDSALLRLCSYVEPIAAVRVFCGFSRYCDGCRLIKSIRVIANIKANMPKSSCIACRIVRITKRT